ncbi:MAG: hypothetical protein J3K34DRAFT_403777 [Monoraphidium minutum]|nr:MAG: hypothetical protein J3K34DRAFT_403777 [Monoraphidium minutum]
MACATWGWGAAPRTMLVQKRERLARGCPRGSSRKPQAGAVGCLAGRQGRAQVQSRRRRGVWRPPARGGLHPWVCASGRAPRLLQAGARRCPGWQAGARRCCCSGLCVGPREGPAAAAAARASDGKGGRGPAGAGGGRALVRAREGGLAAARRGTRRGAPARRLGYFHREGLKWRRRRGAGAVAADAAGAGAWGGRGSRRPGRGTPLSARPRRREGGHEQVQETGTAPTAEGSRQGRGRGALREGRREGGAPRRARPGGWKGRAWAFGRPLQLCASMRRRGGGPMSGHVRIGSCAGRRPAARARAGA